MVRQRIDRIGVVGAGTMGSGIAQVSAMHGYEVMMRDVEDRFLEHGFDLIDDSLGRFAATDSLDESPESVRKRITGTTAWDALEDCDLVFEAVVEDMDIKQEVFERLESICEPDVLLSTNTSTLSITSIASALDHPGRVVGIHFMNPVPVMDGVEIIAGEKSTTEAMALAHEVATQLGKTTWEADDKPGFVVNRVLMPWINEGIRAYDEGVASKEDIDAGMELGTNVPMGPLRLADHIGLDVCLQATETLHAELGDRYKPAYLLKRKVAAGDLGKKTGAGFYEYD